MQICPQCLRDNPSESRFCGFCAQKLNNNCPDCGFKNLPDQQFCGSCGKHLFYSEPDAKTRPVHTPPSTLPAEKEAIAQSINAESFMVPFDDSPIPVQASEPILTPVEPDPAEFGTDTFAITSIEFTNFEELVKASDNVSEVERYQWDCLTFLRDRFASVDGLVESAKGSVLFVSFRQETSVRESCLKAVHEALRLLDEKFHFKDIQLQMRIGIALKKRDEDNPMAANEERTVAQPGMLVVGQAVFAHIHDEFVTEAFGPFDRGGELTMFYQIIHAGQATLPAAVFTEPEIITEEAPLPEPVYEAPQIETTPAPPPAARPAKPPGSDTFDLNEAPEDVVFEPPVLGLFKATRTASISYVDAYTSLTGQFKAFIERGAGGKGQIISLSATDGLGKTHIYQMAKNAVDPANESAIWIGAHHFRSVVDKATQQSPCVLSTWTSLFQNVLGLIAEGHPRLEAQERLAAYLRHIHQGELPVEDFEFFKDLLSINPLQPLDVHVRERLGLVEEILFRTLQTMAKIQPVVLILDDLQYADSASLTALARLLKRGLLNLPVLVLMTHTRDFHVAGELQDAITQLPYLELVVSNMNAADAKTFLDQGPLGGRAVEFPVAFLDQMAAASTGLPIYMEETLRLFHLQGLLGIDPETFKFRVMDEAALLQAPMPKQVSDIISQRLAYLSEQGRYLLQVASVLGEKFSLGMLIALSSMEPDAFNDTLMELYNHGFAKPDATLTGSFQHGIIWQTVYEQMSFELKLQLHQLVSEALDADRNRDITVSPSLIAYHADAGEMKKRALAYWNLTGIHAAQVGSLAGANLALFRVIDMLDASDELDAENPELGILLYETLGVLNIDENPTLAMTLLRWIAYTQQQENGDISKRIETLGFLSACEEAQGNIQGALQIIETSIGLLPPGDFQSARAAILVSKLEYLYTLGKLAQAHNLMTQEISPILQSESLAQEPEYFNTYLNARLLQAQIMIEQCDNRAFEVIEESLSFARERNLEGLNVALQLALVLPSSKKACLKSAIAKPTNCSIISKRWMKRLGFWGNGACSR